MDLLNELVKEHQKTLLNEARVARRFEPQEREVSVKTGWRINVGNFLIASGMRLKRCDPNTNKSVRLTYNVR